MKKEQIIEVLQKHIFADGDIWVIYDLKKMYDDLLPILAIPLDVPSDEEIKKTALDYAPVYYLAETNDDVNDQIREEVEDLLKDLRDEIIKRNK